MEKAIYEERELELEIEIEFELRQNQFSVEHQFITMQNNHFDKQAYAEYIAIVNNEFDKFSDPISYDEAMAALATESKDFEDAFLKDKTLTAFFCFRNRGLNTWDINRKIVNQLSNSYMKKFVPEGTLFIPDIHMEIYRNAAKFAKEDTSILIVGESGTGKSKMAEFIHMNSARKGAFKIFNAALYSQKHLMEMALFGSVKGAFTGVDAHDGLIKEAGNGTLFIDEIDKLEMELQGMLLHVIEYKNYRKVGDSKDSIATCRFLFATNANLCDYVEKGMFLRDLYFRIQLPDIKLPPFKKLPKRSFFFYLLRGCFNKKYKNILDTEPELLQNSLLRSASPTDLKSPGRNAFIKYMNKYYSLARNQTDGFKIWDIYEWPANQREFIMYFNTAMMNGDWKSYFDGKITDSMVKEPTQPYEGYAGANASLNSNKNGQENEISVPLKTEINAEIIAGNEELDDKGFMVEKGGGYFFPEFDYWQKKDKPGETVYLIINNPDCNSKDGINPKYLYPLENPSEKKDGEVLNELDGISELKDCEDSGGSSMNIDDGTESELLIENSEAVLKSLDKFIKKLRERLKNEEYDGIEEREELEAELKKHEDWRKKTKNDAGYRGKPKGILSRRQKTVKSILNDIDRFIDRIDTSQESGKKLQAYFEANRPKKKDGRIYYSGKT